MYTGEYMDTVIDAATFVAPYMTVLCLKTDRTFRRRTVAILPDSIDGEVFRQLRVWLRWKWKNDFSDLKK